MDNKNECRTTKFNNVCADALLAEYEGLRKETLQTLREENQLRLAVITSTTLLLGILGATGHNLESLTAKFIPFIIFILCAIAITQMRSQRETITGISVYIEIMIERNPIFKNSIAWERTCARRFPVLSKGPPWIIIYREPYPLIAVVMLIFSFLVAWNMASYKLPYIGLHIVLFIILIVKTYKSSWIDRGRVKSDIIKALNAENIQIV